mgnify:CR=1 FL=1
MLLKNIDLYQFVFFNRRFFYIVKKSRFEWYINNFICGKIVDLD